MAERALVVRGSFRGPTGHDHHVREFVRALARRGVRVQLVDQPEWSPARLPDHLQDPWFETLDRPVPARTALHFCMPTQVTAADAPGGRLHVNYTMFEATRVPPTWVEAGRRHALVVVPTASSRAAWTASGFPARQLRLCPLGVDPCRFRPGVTPLDLPSRRGRRVAEYRTRILNVSDVTPRKNLAALFRVWLRATRATDDAILVVKLGRTLPGRLAGLFRDLHAAERLVGKTREAAAPWLLDDRVLGDAEMPALFAAATHYWSTSHGEGWDQPMVEAAATGLRLIAPAHSAYLAYLGPADARWIPSPAVPATLEGDPELAALFAGAEWWAPDEEAAVEAVRDAIEGRDRASPTLQRRVARELTWERATDRLLEILDDAEGGPGPGA